MGWFDMTLWTRLQLPRRTPQAGFNASCLPLTILSEPRKCVRDWKPMDPYQKIGLKAFSSGFRRRSRRSFLILTVIFEATNSGETWGWQSSARGTHQGNAYIRAGSSPGSGR